MSGPSHLAQGFATAMLAGPWQADPMRQRLTAAIGRPPSSRPRWLAELIETTLAAYRDAPADRPRELAAYLLATPAFGKAWAARRRPAIVAWTPVPTAIVHAPWPVTPLPDLSAVAALLSVDAGELAWFADVRSLERQVAEPLRHYRWRVLPKRYGVRPVAAPKPRLKEIQRRLLRHLYGRMGVHDAAHGGVPGRSVRTALQPHSGATVVIRADLEAFFPTIAADRIWGVTRLAGVPESVAHALTGLVTTVVPQSFWTAVPPPDEPRARAAHRRLGAQLARPHLPQGAPTSPAIANLTAYRLDRRLSGLAARFGARYTRYVDDLTFSGGPSLRSARSRFVDLIEQIVHDEGWRVNPRKTVVLGASGRQQALGCVLNDHPTLPRPERDALRATLHNCRTRGWASQSGGRDRDEFRDYLLGRVAWAGGIDPAFGRRVRPLFDAIDFADR